MNWFRRKLAGLRRLTYEDSKELIEAGGVADRRRVAGHQKSRPEVLYYLASDPDPTVRGLVAANAATPRQADALLAADGDDGVREVLARKIALLAPGLTADEKDHIRQITYQTLVVLARDQANRVRRVVAKEIAGLKDAPAEIVHLLADDPEIEVAGPILRFSPMLSDEDLLAIIEGSGTTPRLKAIARRSGLASDLTDRIVAAGDAAAIEKLLDNPTAQIRETTLDLIIEGARAETRWQRPLVGRPSLSAAAVGKLAEFVALDLLKLLRARMDMDSATSTALEKRVRERLAAEGGVEPAEDVDALRTRAMRLKETGKLDADALIEMSERGERAHAAATFAVHADVPPTLVERVIEARSAKGVVSLAWKAGLRPDSATRLQLRMLKLPASAVLRGAEASWPLSAESMEWHLDFFRADAR
jgi:uncharacterized protein (DUF2336 family)